jgi:hypothetical protein
MFSINTKMAGTGQLSTVPVSAGGVKVIQQNRDGQIRTDGILLPKQARYQAALHPGEVFKLLNPIYPILVESV